MTPDKDKSRSEEVTPDDQTRIIRPEEKDLISEPVRPIPPAPPLSGGGKPSEFADRPSGLPDPAPIPEATAKPSGSKLRLTRKKTTPAPTPQPAPTRRPDPVSFDLPKEPPASQRQPAYIQDDDDDQDSGSGGVGTALAIGAFILSIAALLVSLGIISVGSDPEITSDQIAPGAVRDRQISEGAISADKLQPQLITDLKGQVGPTGKTGPTGRRGKIGPTGPAGFTELSTMSTSVDGTAASEVSSTSSCEAGQVAIAGGAAITGANGSVAVTSSQPLPDLSGWRASAAQVADTKAAWVLEVYSVCGKPSREIREGLPND